MRSWRRVLRSLAGIALTLLAPAAAGQGNPNGSAPGQKPPPVQAVVELGMGGYLQADLPVPVRVTLTNTGDPVSDGRIEVTSQELRTERSFDLPRQGQKRYVLFIRVPHVDPRRGTPRDLRVNLYAGRRLLASQTLLMRFLQSGERLVASITDEAAGLAFLNEPGSSTFERPDRERLWLRGVHVAPDAVPRHWAEWGPVDLLVVNGRAWEQLDPDQRRAIRRWTDQGGRLIACADLLTQWRDQDGNSLLPVQPAALRTVRSLPEVHSLAGPLTTSPDLEVPLTVVVGRPRPGAEALASLGDDSDCIGAWRPQVLGSVVWLGFDPFQPALRSWAEYDPFWRQLLSGVAGQALPGSAVGALDGQPPARETAGTLPPLRPPPLGALIAFAVAYAAIFGPFNIWILSRLRRTVRAWLFMPALALAMTIAVLVVGQSWGQARTVVNSLCVLEADSGSRTAVAQTLSGIFSPTSREFDVTAQDPASEFVPLEVAAIESAPSGDPGGTVWPDSQDDLGSRYLRQPLLQYSLRLQRLRRVVDLGAGVEVTLAGRAGQVRNDTDWTLRGAYLYVPASRGEGRSPQIASGGRRWHPLPDLAPGETAEVSERGWQSRSELTGAITLPGGADERQTFAARFQFLRENAPGALLRPNRRTRAWLVAEMVRFSPGLKVTNAPASSEAALLLLRVP